MLSAISVTQFGARSETHPCTQFGAYSEGIYYEKKCSTRPSKLNHAVILVGWGEREGEPYFIVRNTWSSLWVGGRPAGVQGRVRSSHRTGLGTFGLLDGRPFKRRDLSEPA